MNLSPDQISQCEFIIHDRIGMNLSRIKSLKVKEVFNESFQPFLDFSSYKKFLSDSSIDTEEYQSLLNTITVGETFFFRHFDIIEKDLLNKLIERNQNNKVLKIWCAGCSTGEEPYTIAMIISEMDIDHSEWNISIYATDICQNSLAIARKGLFSEWSFRETPNYYKEKYFEKVGNKYSINQELSRLITFEFHNLMCFSEFSKTKLDLILCRNVMIYFNIDLIERLAQFFHLCLKDDSYLIVGSSEPSHQLFKHFDIEFSKSNVIYRKAEQISENIEPSNESAVHRLEKLKVLYKKKRYEEMKEELSELYISNKYDVDIIFLYAKLEADLKNYDIVKDLCDEIFCINSQYSYAHYLLGMVYKEEAIFTKSEYHIKRCIALMPRFYLAHLELAQIYILQNRMVELKKFGININNLLKKCDDKEVINFIDDVCLGDIKSAFKTLIAGL